MNSIAGLVLLALAAVMVLVARPGDGESAPFLKVWIVGQLYALAAMITGVAGITLVIINWPF